MDFLGKKAGRVRIEAKTIENIRGVVTYNQRKRGKNGRRGLHWSIGSRNEGGIRTVCGGK